MKAYTGPDSYAFMSYSRKDADRIAPLLNKLQNAGCRIWYDEGIHNSSEWTEIIADRLANTSLLFVVISQNSIESKYVRREIKYAEGKNIPILPYYIENVALPPELEFLIGTMQSVHTTGDLEADFKAVCADFPKDAPNAPDPPPRITPQNTPTDVPWGGSTGASGTGSGGYAWNPNIPQQPSKKKKSAGFWALIVVLALAGIGVLATIIANMASSKPSDPNNTGTDGPAISDSGTHAPENSVPDNTDAPDTDLPSAHGKEFSKAGITLTLTEDFSEPEDDDGNDYVLESEDVVVFANKIDFELLEYMDMTPETTSLTEFAKLVIELAELPEDTAVVESNGLTSFVYETEAIAGSIYCYAVVYKGSNAFWTVEFLCLDEERDLRQPEFIEYAKAVVVE